jgi:hypothetical protein
LHFFFFFLYRRTSQPLLTKITYNLKWTLIQNFQLSLLIIARHMNRLDSKTIRNASVGMRVARVVVISDLLDLGDNLAVKHWHVRAVIGRLLKHNALFVEQITLCLEKVPSKLKKKKKNIINVKSQ